MWRKYESGEKQVLERGSTWSSTALLFFLMLLLVLVLWLFLLSLMISSYLKKDRMNVAPIITIMVNTSIDHNIDHIFESCLCVDLVPSFYEDDLQF